MAEGGRRPMIESEKDKDDFKFLLERTFDRFQHLQAANEKDAKKKKDKKKSKNTSSDASSLLWPKR